MTLLNVFERLRALDQTASSLLRDTKFQTEEYLGESVCSLTDEAEDTFLRAQAEQLLELLQHLHETLRYLEQPHHGEYTLEQLPSGRYGYFDHQGNKHTFTCGDSLEVKIHAHCDLRRWVRTRIEHDGFDYFLWGYRSIPL